MESWFSSLQPVVRILIILILAFLAHFIIRELRQLVRWILTLNLGRSASTEENFTRRYPRFASLTTIAVGAVTFTIYFAAVGLVLNEFNVSLTAYLASASVIGLAIAFGSQGLVQDVVIGLTLIFSDVLKVQDVVEVSGQIGRVENIGLRFTTIINHQGQTIFLPNRNIGMISRYRNGVVRAYVDIQVPDSVPEPSLIEMIERISVGMQSQFNTIILSKPELQGVKEVEGKEWKYLRLRLRIWPGQNTLIDTVVRQRIINELKKLFPEYSDWMVTVTYRAQ